MSATGGTAHVQARLIASNSRRTTTRSAARHCRDAGRRRATPATLVASRPQDGAASGSGRSGGVAADVDAGLVGALLGDRPRAARRARCASAAPGVGRRRWAQPTTRRGSSRHGDPVEVALQPAGDGGGRHDRRAVALERQRGHQAHAVDLHLRAAARRRRWRAARSSTRRSAVPRGGSSSGGLGDLVQRDRPRARRAGATRARAARGPRRTAARRPARGRRPAGG